MRFQLNQFLLAVSDALDFVEIDILGATTNHSKRVALISILLGEEFNFNEDEIYDLCSFAILHDNGLAQEVFSSPVKNSKKEKRTNLERYRLHCRYGEDNVKDYPFLTNQRDIILYHHENYDGSGYFKIKGDEIPLMAQIIALADTVDNMFHFENNDVKNRDKIKKYINDNINRYYSSSMVDAFNKISSPVSFWLNLQEPYLFEQLKTKLPLKSLELEIEDIYKITKVFSKIVDSKSKFTFNHSSGLEEKVAIMCDFYNFSSDKKIKMMIAASLHDLGKLAISNGILNKAGKLDYIEMEIMKSHTFYTAQALKKIDGFNDISKWSANHHEKLDGSGYPFGYNGEQLSFQERLMGCLDIYQALTENRPYRNGMKHKNAIKILKEQASQGLIDKDIVNDIEIVFKKNRDKIK